MFWNRKKKTVLTSYQCEYEGCMMTSSHGSRVSQQSIWTVFITKSKLLHKLTPFYVAQTARGCLNQWVAPCWRSAWYAWQKRNGILGPLQASTLWSESYNSTRWKSSFVIWRMSLPWTASLSSGPLWALYTLKCSSRSADLTSIGDKNLILNTHGELTYHASYDKWLKGKGRKWRIDRDRLVSDAPAPGHPPPSTLSGPLVKVFFHMLETTGVYQRCAQRERQRA